MKLRFIISIILLFCFAQGHAQLHAIDFVAETLNSNCNVFSSTVTVDNYDHQTTKGTPVYTASPGWYVNLPCKRNSSTNQTGSEYQILHPFKQGYTYTINVYYKGTFAPTEFSPMLAVGLNATKKAIVTSCAGAQATSQTGYLGTYASGSNFAWISTPITISTPLTQDYESISIGSIPWPGNSATQTQGIQVRRVEIYEYAPPTNKITDIIVEEGGLQSLNGWGIEECFSVAIWPTYTTINNVPESDLSFEYRLVPPVAGLVQSFSLSPFTFPVESRPRVTELVSDNKLVLLNAPCSPRSIDWNDGFAEIEVRIKQKSTNLYLIDWYKVNFHTFYP